MLALIIFSVQSRHEHKYNIIQPPGGAGAELERSEKCCLCGVAGLSGRALLESHRACKIQLLKGTSCAITCRSFGPNVDRVRGLCAHAYTSSDVCGSPPSDRVVMLREAQSMLHDATAHDVQIVPLSKIVHLLSSPSPISGAEVEELHDALHDVQEEALKRQRRILQAEANADEAAGLHRAHGWLDDAVKHLESPLQSLYECMESVKSKASAPTKWELKNRAPVLGMQQPVQRKELGVRATLPNY